MTNVDFSNIFNIRKLIPNDWKDTVIVEAYRVCRIDELDVPKPNIYDLNKMKLIIDNGILIYPDCDRIVDFDGDKLSTNTQICKTNKGSYLIIFKNIEDSYSEEKETEWFNSYIVISTIISGRNLAYRKIFGITVKIETSKFSVLGSTMRFPLYFPKPDIQFERFKMSKQILDKIFVINDNLKKRILLSMKWYYSSLYDVSVDSFIKVWFAIEILAMPDTTNIAPINDILGKEYGLSRDETINMLNIGRLFGLRSSIIHGGNTNIHEQASDYVEAVYIDLLYSFLEIESEKRIKKVLEKPGFEIKNISA